MAPNGQLPASSLASIPGNGRLLRSAARAWTSMHILSSRRGVSLKIVEGPVRRTYRPLSAQRMAWRIFQAGGNLAARPGTSNHGWGLAVDLMTLSQRRSVDQIGRAFGWSKAWSDAPSEWWHLRWRPGVYAAVHTSPRTVRLHSQGKTVARLNDMLRHKGFKSVPASGHRGHQQFTRKTLSAVLRFQKKHHLKADGIVGPSTWAALAR